jgi:hypothetical protein
MNQQEIIAGIKYHYRRRQHAMKLQSAIDRSTESFVRINGDLGWDPNADQATRDKVNKAVMKLIKDIRKGKQHACAQAVIIADKSRAPADEMEEEHRTAMERLTDSLPIAPWIKSVHGIGILGLAIIVAQAGDLSNYSKPCKLWKRLFFAPYDGLAGSTWLREKWRPRALTKEEWIENPFSNRKYAPIQQIGERLVNWQTESAEKSGTEFGRPKGRYGEKYVYRRECTKHRGEEWPLGRCRKDAVRYATKAFLKDLWKKWNQLAGTNVVIDDEELQDAAA